MKVRAVDLFEGLPGEVGEGELDCECQDWEEGEGCEISPYAFQ